MKNLSEFITENISYTNGSNFKYIHVGLHRVGPNSITSLDGKKNYIKFMKDDIYKERTGLRSKNPLEKEIDSLYKDESSWENEIKDFLNTTLQPGLVIKDVRINHDYNKGKSNFDNPNGESETMVWYDIYNEKNKHVAGYTINVF